MNVAFGSDTIDSNSILVVGEYTTTDGPMLDDYFLVIITKDRRLLELSMSDPGANESLTSLSRALGVSIERGLANRTDFSSRVLFPVAFLDRPLFKKKEVASSKQERGFFARFRRQPPDEWIIDQGLLDAAEGARFRS